MPRACPAENELRDYHVGTLTEHDLDRIADHLGRCERCSEALERIEREDDGMLAALRGLTEIETDAARRAGQGGRVDSNEQAGEFEASDVIGPYRIARKLGEGGMGIIYLAEQDHPVRRRVALKVIRPGLDSARILERFEAERRTLALMDHPNVARIHDAGLTPSGRPYFAMELVDGAPIHRFCDDARLPTPDRVRLVISVCRAVQHAHQKGVIHRDIKPSNILVTVVDGQPVPKVIDFGIAKAIADTPDDRSAFTQVGAVVGTLEYMSPEQAEPDRLDVDTRSDVYALGVLLYELLTGSTPLRGETLRDQTYTEILRRIREEDAPRASDRLREAPGQIDAIAAARAAEPARLIRDLRGDLDWIAMKATEKDRSRRYDSAGALAADLERHLALEPVEARPPTVVYRLSKFGRKHRVGLGVAAGFVALLLLATGVSLSLMVRARAAERLARSRGDELTGANERISRALSETQDAQRATQAALSSSEESRRQAEQLSKFLLDAFRSPDPALDGRSIKVADLLDRAATSLSTSFQGSDLSRAAFLQALGSTYQGLGLAPRAVPLLERAGDLRAARLGPDAHATLESRNALASAYFASNRQTEALALQARTVELALARPEPEDEIAVVSRSQLAQLHMESGRADEAVALLEPNRRSAEAVLGPEHPATLDCRANLAWAYRSLGRLADAVALDEATLRAAAARLGRDDPRTLSFRDALANDYQAAGRLADAIALHKENLALREARLGPDHTDTLTARNSLAIDYQMTRREPEAVPLHETNLKLREAGLPPDHFNVLATRNNLAAAYAAVGRVKEAIALHEETLRRCEDRFGPDHQNTLTSQSALAVAYLADGRADDAARLQRKTLDRRRERLGPRHASTLGSLAHLAQCLIAAGRPAEAAALLGPQIDDFRQTFGPDHPRTRNALDTLARARK